MQVRPAFDSGPRKRRWEDGQTRELHIRGEMGWILRLVKSEGKGKVRV